jgi:hypothetical protein
VRRTRIYLKGNAFAASGANPRFLQFFQRKHRNDSLPAFPDMQPSRKRD